MYDNNDVIDFIGQYQIQEDLCDKLIQYFHDNKELQAPGEYVGGSDPSMKESTDIGISAEFAEEPVYSYRMELQECVNSYCKDYPEVSNLHHFNVVEGFNIQYYKPTQGYKTQHAERMGNFDKTLKRCLVFMTYLNTLDAGGPIFTNYNKVINAKKGRTLIWPSDWTHTHKGQISNDQEKYIITGWLSYTW